MQLHQLPKLNKKSARRVGRGGKRGTTSGRGQKGQKSRAGHRIRPAERDLIIRIPKRRGFRNKPKSPRVVVLNLSDILGKTKSLILEEKNGVLDLEFLRRNGFLSKNYRGRVKLLGNGDIDFPLSVAGIEISKSAKAKIEKARGAIIKNSKQPAESRK